MIYKVLIISAGRRVNRRSKLNQADSTVIDDNVRCTKTSDRVKVNSTRGMGFDVWGPRTPDQKWSEVAVCNADVDGEAKGGILKFFFFFGWKKKDGREREREGK